jgi:hypothetical protein
VAVLRNKYLQEIRRIWFSLFIISLSRLLKRQT